MRLHFKSFGEGEPVVIIHGLFGMLDNWKSFAKKLAENYTVYIIDLRNHGKSPHEEGIDYSLMAEDVVRFMEDEWIYEARVIGHSMGGKVLLQLLEEYPDQILQAVVVDISTKKYKGGHQKIFEAMLSAPVETSDSRKEIEDHLSNYIEEKDVVQFLMKNLSRIKEGGFRWKMNLNEIYKNYENILAEINLSSSIDVPTLFVRGDRSNYISDEDFENMKKTIPEASLFTVADSGHWVHAEKPGVLLDKCLGFFEEK